MPTDDESFESLCFTIASCSLDASNPSIRKSKTHNALKIVKEDENARKLLSSKFGLDVVEQCTSSYSYHRILNILTSALTNHCKDIIEINTADGEGTSNNAQFQEINGIAKCICQVLIRQSLSSSSLQYETPIQIQSKKQTPSNVFPTILDIVKDIDSQIGCKYEKRSHALKLLVESFLHVLKQPDTSKNKGEYAPAISILQCFIALLQTTSNDFHVSTYTTTMMDLFVKRALSTSGKFASMAEINLASNFIQSLTQDKFDQYIISTIALKLRANPEAIIGTATAIVRLFSISHSANNSITNNISMSAHLEGDSKLLTAALRQLRSPKLQMRIYATTLLCHLASSSSKFDTIPTILKALSEGLMGNSKTGVSFSTPDQREAVYPILDYLSDFILKITSDNTNTNIDIKVLDESISSALEAVSTAQNKEGTANSSTKDAGMKALFSLLRLSFTMDSRTTNGCKAALTFLSKPILDATSKTSSASSAGPQLKYRIGSILTYAEDDFIEKSFISEIFQLNDKVGKGLELIIDASIKKFGTSSVVPQIDGLIAVYLLLTQCTFKSTITIPPQIIKIMSGNTENSFLFCSSMLEHTKIDSIVGKLLPRCIALFCSLLTQDKMDESLDKRAIFQKMFFVIPTQNDSTTIISTDMSGAARALAACISNPRPSSDLSTYTSISTLQQSIKAVLNNTPDSTLTAHAIIDALLATVQILSKHVEHHLEKLNDTRESRESNENASQELNRGKLFSENHRGYDSYSIRTISNFLATFTKDKYLGKLLILLHVGTSFKSVDGKQRKALNRKVESIIGDNIVPGDEENRVHFNIENLAVIIASCATKPNNSEGTDEENEVFGLGVYEAAISLIMTLGSVGGLFDPEFDDPDDEELAAAAFARSLCVEHIAKQLASNLMRSLKAVQSLTSDDIDLYRSKEGVLFGSVSGEYTSKESAKGTQNVEKKRAVKSRKHKGDFGAGFEEEEWERQVKKELAEKKGAQKISNESSLTSEEKKQLENQTQRRKVLSKMLTIDFNRSLEAVQSLVMSDMEIGNACLPVLSFHVTLSAVSVSPAFQMLPALKNKSFETLRILSTCVFEIDEAFSYELAKSIVLSYRIDTTTKKSHDPSIGASNDLENLKVSALPSPCPTAASIISEIYDYNDLLSGSSFAFVFPVVRAALTGPRTPPGCEYALTILHRHMSMIAGENSSPSVAALRKEMALTVLELLSHDRSQMFSDPSPIEALCACYILSEKDSTQVSMLSPGEVAPLLGENGALAGKNCRIGSMIALGSIALQQPKLVKNNPLVENRIWINCFDKDTDVKQAARKAWGYANRTADQDEFDDADIPAPSQMYSIPILPLLDHDNSSVAHSSANAYAHAMGKHPVTIEKNIIRVCDTYIEAFPTVFEESKPIVAPPTPAKIPKAKKIVKKPSKTGTLKIGQGSKPRKTKALNIPKSKAREVEKSVLESQFLLETSKSDEGKDNSKNINIRLGVLRVLAAIPNADVELPISILKVLISFLISYGLADPEERVRNTARNAARDIVSKFGDTDEALNFLLPHFEAVLKTGKADESCLGSLSTEKVLRNTLASDRRKEGAVVCLGSTAIHLKGDENLDKIDNTIDMLITALKTPSEDVQSSVAMCLSKLMKKGRTPERIELILSKLMTDCLRGDSLAVRRGSAYGISAVIKGSGISSLKKYGVITQLDEACSSGGTSAKEGALFTIELLSARLGLLFEPYVIVLLPALLKAFSDSSDHVRLAAAGTADLIMSKLSAHGVKLVMPAVLTAFSEPAWRTKQASIHMLGSMSHCAPKQLANCLPKVVPKLTEAFSDTHTKVKTSAEDALKQICKVIKNPEISSISPVLLKALTDPANETITALEALIETEFLHAIDSPSLALLVPVLHRGLRDRAAKTKRFGALISGNICTMINDPRDFLPYLPTLLPDLKAVLLDPIPDVRNTASKALGSLTRGLGEDSLPDLRPWLIETLKGENGTAVERSGAAQGLTEVLVAGGASLVEDVMREEILPLKSHPQASTREGVLWVLTFMPSSLGQAFTPLIDVSLPALLSGLSDDNEQIREVALRAGRVLIRSHGKAHVYKILPSLENGLIDDDWRIRVSSLTLLGDLLSLIGGTKVVKGDNETQDDLRQAERAQAQIALALGSDTRKRILSGVYFARSDVAAVVRSSAVQVWKTVVSVTARTLREILDVLIGKVVKALASGNPEQTQVAGRCLGDIVRKLGDTVLPEVIPVLRDELTYGDNNTRKGACIGLTEVIDSSSKEQIHKFLHILLKAVQAALGDEDEGVQKMAASCFQSLHNVVGSRASDEVVPSLLAAMETSVDDISRHRALNGLTGILRIRSKELLPYLVMRLTKKPITKVNAEALATIATVTGGTIHPFFRTIIPSFLNELDSADDSDAERVEAIRACARSIFSNVEASSIDWLVSEIASKCTNDKDGIRKESCWMLGAVVEERKENEDFFDQVPTMYRELLYRLNDGNTQVIKAANVALMALAKNISAEELVNHIEFCRNLVASIVSEARRRKGGVGDGEFLLPGFNMPKGLEPLLPMYQRGILYGNANIREVAAAGLGELISITSSKYLAGPFIIKLTGPLLRVVGDRNPSAVKVAIVQTLGLILTKGGLSLRAFVPQFQTTFVKALSDPSRQVRVEAIRALALLMPLSTRLDPLIKELISGSLGGNSATASIEIGGAVAVQTATLNALACVLNHGGKKAKLPASIPSALGAGKELLFHEDEGIREGASKVIGAACGVLGVEKINEIVSDVILDGSVGSDTDDIKHGKACACRYIFSCSCGTGVDTSMYKDVVKLIMELMNDHNNSVREAACVAVGAIIGSSSEIIKCVKLVEPMILKGMKSSEDIEIHKSVAKGLCIAVSLNVDAFHGEYGIPIINGALKLAMSGTQKVQYAFNEFLWLVMRISEGDGTKRLNWYYETANFENVRTMKTLAAKVLIRIKGVELDN